MNRKALLNAIAVMLTGLSDMERYVLAEQAYKFMGFVSRLVDETVRKSRKSFTAIADSDAPAHLVGAVTKWRKLASDHRYTGPVLWAVKAGFTLKTHAPLIGPPLFGQSCFKQFSYLWDWKLKNDEPTQDSWAFFIPRIIATGKNVKEQKQALAELRARYDLPENHLNSFGSAALVSGLILSHFKRTRERVPHGTNWVRTDTFRSFGRRLFLGGFDGYGLVCVSSAFVIRNEYLGVFPLGVEMGS